MQLHEANEKIHHAFKNREMCIIIGECRVEYIGRATSKLPIGKRMILIKADQSISVHENRLIRPTNYMVGGSISSETNKDKKIVLTSKKLKPKEIVEIIFDSIEDVKSYDVPESNDLRLTGSERELNDALMDDLNFLEPGLKPINQQEYFKKGICDIIAIDAKGRLVVIELKRRQADYASVTQLKRYMDEVKKMKGKEVRGILLAPEIRKTALNLLHEYGLEFFSYNFEMGERSKIKGIGKSQMKINEYH